MRNKFVRAILGVFVILGLILTSWRIYFRLRIGRFWWEDAWATAAFFTGCVWLSGELREPYNDEQEKIVKAWIYSLSFTALIVMVRMSLLFSIFRLVNRGRVVLSFTRGLTAFIFLSGLAIITVKIWRCASSSTWHHNALAHGESWCTPEPPVALIEIISSLISIAILVALPLHLLWRVKLPPRQRRMILSIFASSILLAFAAIFHAVGQISVNFYLMIIGLNLEVILSLFICNLLVVVTYTYRYILPNKVTTTDEAMSAAEGVRGERDWGDDDDFTQPAGCTQTSRGFSLTTIGLESYTTSRWSGNQCSSDQPCH